MKSSYPRIVTCRLTGMQAWVDGRPAEIAFRAMAPCFGLLVLLATLAVVLAAIGVIA